MKSGNFGKIRFLIIFLLLTYANIFPQDSILQAYSYMSTGRLNDAERLFLKETGTSDSCRAYIGLSYLYDMEAKTYKSWNYFYKAIKATDDPEPYIITALNGLSYSKNSNIKKPGIIKLLEEEAGNKKDGYINAVACENLGTYYLSNNEYEKAREYFNRIGAIKKWSVIGPFENISASGYNRQFGPEKEFDTVKIYTGKNNKPVHWFNIYKIRLDDWVDFTMYFPTENSVFYGNTFIYSPEKRKVQIRIGTSGSYKAFLNDQLISECYEERNNDLDTYIDETTLRKGWNRLMLKVGYSDISSCNFLVRITDEKGFPLKDLLYSTDKKDYNHSGSEKVTAVGSPYEKYFERKIKMQPDYPDNYMLLSEIYIRNEKLTEAEELLKNRLKITPNNLLLMYELLSVYSKEGKTTELNTLSAKIDNIKKDIPAVVLFKLMDAIKNKNKDKYKSLIEKIIPLMPESPELYEFEIGDYSLKNNPAKVVSTINEAYRKYPGVWTIVALKERLDYSVNRDYKKAVELVGKFCMNNYTYNAFNELANLYLQLSDVDKWDSTYSQIIRHNPAAPGYYYQMAKTYYSLQQYDKAKDKIQESLRICPFSTTYYEMLGDIYAAQNNSKAAGKAYLDAIKYSSTNYDAREKLKNIDSTKSAGSDIKPFDIKSLLADSSNAVSFPGDDALILCDDVKRTFYEGGASEYDVEILIKILTKDGISHFTDYDIDYNPNVQDIIFDKAVVIKKDGSRIDADKNDGEVVFKSLDINDCIYMKYKIRNYYTGELFNHFWDAFNFNLYYPIKNIRYSLILPSGKKVYYRGQNMDSNPAVKKTEGKNTIYIWQMSNIPSIKYEAGMPPLNDVGKILYVSTIKDWDYISGWYYNLTGSKTIANYEIKEKVNEILNGSASLPVEEKIKKIYDYIVQNITYSSVPFRQSAFIPQKARDVLVTKIGDCKDMATLFITMLKVIGVDADYVLVDTKDNGLNRNALPGNYFNHAIAKVIINGKPEFFDLTARNYPAGTLPAMDIGSFALDITQGKSEPFYISADNLYPRQIIRNADAVIGEDNSVEIKVKTERTGAITADVRDSFADISQNDRIKKISENLSDLFSNIKVTSFTCDNLDTLTSRIDNDCSFTLKQYLGTAGNFKLLKIPWEDRVTSGAAFSYDRRQYAYDRDLNADLLKETIKIKLPKGYTPVEIPDSVNLECSEAAYSVKYKFADGIISAERSMKNKSDIVEPKDYKEYKDFINKVINSDLTQILLKKTKGS